MEFPPFALTESKKAANFVKSVLPGPISAAKFTQAMFAPLAKRGRLLYSIFEEDWENAGTCIKHNRQQTQEGNHTLMVSYNFLNWTSFRWTSGAIYSQPFL
jgi:hypothetical protein